MPRRWWIAVGLLILVSGCVTHADLQVIRSEMLEKNDPSMREIHSLRGDPQNVVESQRADLETIQKDVASGLIHLEDQVTFLAFVRKLRWSGSGFNNSVTYKG